MKKIPRISKALNKMVLHNSLHSRFEEVFSKFGVLEVNERVIDSCGKRWLKCMHCGFVMLSNCFVKPYCLHNLKLGTCVSCNYKILKEYNKNVSCYSK